MHKILNKLFLYFFSNRIEYYKTGDLQIWDDYNVAWTAATEGNVDYINSFIEVYNDPLGYRGSYETIVQINDFDMSQKMKVLSELLLLLLVSYLNCTSVIK